MAHPSMSRPFAASKSNLLPSPSELEQTLTLTLKQKQFIKRSRQTLVRILQGKDSRRLLIVGPCSIHDTQAAWDYAKKLKILAEQVKDVFFVVMRTYFEKPRTRHGWKGLIYDPHLNQSHDISCGLNWTRQLLHRIADLELPCGTEFLEPLTAHYFQDLISWGCIGARTVESQVHRQMASGLPMPVGFKNSTAGGVDAAIHAVLSAQAPHCYVAMDEQGTLCSKQTQGNPFGHIVLRGSAQSPNYYPESVQHTLHLMGEQLVEPRLVIDCSHDNSKKDHKNQAEGFFSVLEQWGEGREEIRGVMLESFLVEGSQPLSSQLTYGQSITDSCLDWESTQEMILKAHQKLQEHTLSCPIPSFAP